MIKTKLHIFHFISKLNLRRFKAEENSYNLTKLVMYLVIEFFVWIAITHLCPRIQQHHLALQFRLLGPLGLTDPAFRAKLGRGCLGRRAKTQPTTKRPQFCRLSLPRHQPHQQVQQHIREQVLFGQYKSISQNQRQLHGLFGVKFSWLQGRVINFNSEIIWCDWQSLAAM